MASTIAPTVTTADPAVYQQQMGLFPTFAQRIQMDVADGEFTPVATLGVNNIVLPQNAMIDLHMLVLRPSEHLQRIIELKPALCIFHAEANEDLMASFDALTQAGIKTGVALLKNTYPGDVRRYIERVDHVLIFSGKLGEQGGEADLLQTEKVPLIREIKQDVEIGWDGGANMSNIRALAHADIDVINVGSAISQTPDPAAAYNALVAEADKNGVAI